MLVYCKNEAALSYIINTTLGGPKLLKTNSLKSLVEITTFIVK